MSKLVLVDADGLLYIAGAIGEERSYQAVFENEEGDLIDLHVQTAAEVKEFAMMNPEYTLIDRELVVIPGPLEHCLQVAKGKLKDIQSRYGKRIEVYVKGDGTNYRDDLGTIAKYKGNRTAQKPYWLEEIRQYLINTWNAVEVSGKEADDAIATRAYEASKECVICSPDKDLDQIPGLHWNYKKNVEYTIDEWEARAFFWTQVLMGDNADNIKGCWKMGEGTAEPLVWDWITGMLGDEQIWELVVEKYEESMGLPNCPYVGMPADLVALENARLVWMQTEPRRLWTPPGTEPEYLEADLDD